MHRLKAILTVGLCLLGGSTLVGQGTTASTDFLYSRFESYLDSIRRQAGIPGLAAVIVRDEAVVWEAVYGFQDVENAVRVTPDTPFYLADLTQTLAATMLLECAESGRLDLDAPMAAFTGAIPEEGATVRHVLTHTSEGTPGLKYKYAPERSRALTPVVERCAQTSFRHAAVKDLFDRLAMIDTVPGLDSTAEGVLVPELFPLAARTRYADVLLRLAKPYQVDKKGRATPSAYPDQHFDAGTGVVSTARDLAKFIVALDTAVLVEPETLQAAWTVPAAVRPADARPRGLGWFAQTVRNEPVVWSFGLAPNASSAFILKVPRRGMTLILLANSDGLAAPFALADGDVSASFFARLFLTLFP